MKFAPKKTGDGELIAEENKGSAKSGLLGTLSPPVLFDNCGFERILGTSSPKETIDLRPKKGYIRQGIPERNHRFWDASADAPETESQPAAKTLLTVRMLSR